MTGDHSLQKIIEQLSEVLQTAEEASKKTLKGPLPPGTKEQLMTLQGMVAYFKILNLQFLKEAGFSDEEIAHPQPPAPSPENEYERRLLENVTQLSKNAKSGFDNLTFGIKQLKKQKTAPKSRKKKFDRFGGHDKWKPL